MFIKAFFKKIERKFFRKEKSPDYRLLRANRKFRERYPDFEIGIGTYGVPKVFIYSRDVKLSVGSFCSIANDVKIYLGGEHQMRFVTSYPLKHYLKLDQLDVNDQPTKGDVIIGSDVWLGGNCTILSGVTIGNGAVIANGAVVVKDVPPYAIVGGNPAKIIRYRFLPEDIERLLEVKWWAWPLDEIRQCAPLLLNENLNELYSYAERRKATV